MSDKPITHGFDHRPGGMDPIPGLGGHYISGDLESGISITSGPGASNVDLDPATVSWGTDAGAETASEYFDLQDDGSGTHVITILKNGLYIVDAWAWFRKSSAPAANATASIGFLTSNFNIGGMSLVPWLTVDGTNYSAQASVRTRINWPALYGSPPFQPTLQLGQNSGATITAISVSFFVTWIDDVGNEGF